MEQMQAPNRAPVEAYVKAVNEESREVLHLITTPARDRMGDVVDSKGADLRNYKRNPVVLVNHDYRVESIVGRAVNLDVSDDGIYARTQFLDTELAETAFKLAKANLGGWSIGFRGLDTHSIKDGKQSKCKICAQIFDTLAEGKEPGDYITGAWGQHFLKWEMLEYSSVAIPANQDIVNNAVQRGLCPEAHVKQFFNMEQAKPSSDAVDGPTVTPEVEDAALRALVAPHLDRIDRIFGRHEAAQCIADIVRKL